MNCIFMGTPLFAKIILERLLKYVNIDLVVCQPDKPSGREKIIKYNEVKEFAIHKNLNISQPIKIKDNAEFINNLKNIKPDLIIVAAYGKILRSEILEIPKYSSINVHSSILPKYRGAAPINWALINGDKKTGVTIMEMDEGMDTGDIILTKEILIDKVDNVTSLTLKLAELGADCIEEFIKNFVTEKSYKHLKQNHDQSTIAPKINKEISRISWEKTNTEIVNLIRGTNPWPGAKCQFMKTEITIWEAVTDNNISGLKGEIKKFDKDFYICCGKGSIKVLKIQQTGKKVLDGRSFLNGLENKIKKNNIFN